MTTPHASSAAVMRADSSAVTSGASRPRRKRGEPYSPAMGVYVLLDPRDHTIRYVGQSDGLFERLASHTHAGRIVGGRRYVAWRTELRALGLTPVPVVVSTVLPFTDRRLVKGHLNMMEADLIEKAKRRGYDLLNAQNVSLDPAQFAQ